MWTTNRCYLVARLIALAVFLLLLSGFGSCSEDLTPAARTAIAGPVTFTAASASVPAGLPNHLGIGLMNSPTQLSWMTSSGIHWDYRYQYLTGGVNTGDGWTTWSDPPGSFVDTYLQDSGNNGYIPVLTYYQIVASAPNPWDENVSVKLENVSTMKAYYQEWKLLMQKAGAYGRPVVVQVEPDLWGYMQQAHGENGAATPVKVAASGFAEVSGYANTAAGFAKALIHLRDVYAPNVVLGYHVSAWATGKDLIINHMDPVATADQIWAFYQSLGANFDLIFFDPSDRDAAYYQYVNGDGGARWWNDADFATYRTFVERLVDRTGKRAMLWQLPLGNTLYRSMNNTWGHYQDNRVQYWLGNRQHLTEYADAGVMAFLFGAGAYGNTMYTDEMGDGLTNPAPINGNNLQAQYADDDGGYTRLKGAQYYQQGAIPLPVDNPPPGVDSDGDGCSDTQEVAMGFNPNAWYDFYDVPLPVNRDPTPNGVRNRGVSLLDVLAVLKYVPSPPPGGTLDTPNGSGVAYNADKNRDTIPDGRDYDRTASSGPNPPWDAGPPDGVIGMLDVLAALKQVGLDCDPS